MKNLWFTSKEYFKYRWKAKRLHGVHSPFAYEFNEAILVNDEPKKVFHEIEKLRKTLLQDQRTITIQDFGAGSRIHKNNERKISDLAQYAAKKAKHGRILNRIVAHYQFKNILELGTSLGIGTSYLASGNTEAQVTTIEGDPQIAALAQKNFEQLSLQNIEVNIGVFDKVLEDICIEKGPFDLVFIDGNHSYIPTINYYKSIKKYLAPESCVIFDDIYWSSDMARAWDYIKNDAIVNMCIDIYQFGIVFNSRNFKQKEIFILK